MALKAEIDEERIEAYRGTVPLPFERGERRRIAHASCRTRAKVSRSAFICVICGWVRGPQMMQIGADCRRALALRTAPENKRPPLSGGRG